MITQKRLRELLYYDSETGIVTWLVAASRRVKSGQIAGAIDGKGYFQIKIDSNNYKLHRIIWIYTYGSISSNLDIDHINGNRSDNRISNLRCVTRSVNIQNQRFANKTSNKSGYLGVSFEKRDNKWRAQIKINGVQIRIGSYLTPEEASIEYINMKRILHKGCTI